MGQEVEPLSNNAWQQDGLQIEYVEARIGGTVGVTDTDAGSLKLDAEVVMVIKGRIYDASGKVNKRTGDVSRKVVITAEEAHVVHDIATRTKLLNQLGFDGADEPIPATSSPVVPAREVAAMSADLRNPDSYYDDFEEFERDAG